MGNKELVVCLEFMGWGLFDIRYEGISNFNFFIIELVFEYESYMINIDFIYLFFY